MSGKLTSEEFHAMLDEDYRKPISAFSFFFDENDGVTWSDGLFISLMSSEGDAVLHIGDRGGFLKLGNDPRQPVYHKLDPSTAMVRRARIGEIKFPRNGEEVSFDALVGLEDDKVEELLLHTITPRGDHWAGVEAGDGVRVVKEDPFAGETLLSFTGKNAQANIFLPDGSVIVMMSELDEKGGNMVFADSHASSKICARLRIKHAFGVIGSGDLDKIKDEGNRAKAKDFWYHQILVAAMMDGTDKKYIKSAVYTPLMVKLNAGDLRPNVVNGLRKLVESVLRNEAGAFEKAVSDAQSSGALLKDKSFMQPRGDVAKVPAFVRARQAERAERDRQRTTDTKGLTGGSKGKNK